MTVNELTKEKSTQIAEVIKLKEDTEIQKKETDSKQILEKGLRGIENVIEPEIDMFLLIEYIYSSSRLIKLIDIMSKNIAGIGFDFVSKIKKQELKRREVEEGLDLVSEKKLIEQERQIAFNFLDNINDEEAFNSLLRKIMFDKFSFGNAYIEITRDIKGDIAKFYKGCPKTTRIITDDFGKVDKFVQISSFGTKTFFKVFGDQRVLDYKTGQWIEKDKDYEIDGVKYSGKNYPAIRKASEIIHLKIYSISDDYYGCPIWVASELAVKGNRSARIRNAAFFENDGMPRSIISVSGGKMSGDTKLELDQFVNSSGKGASKAHRTMVVDLKKNYGDKTQPKIEIVPLTVAKDEDATHQKYQKENDEEIRETFGIANVLLGTSTDVNRASATITRQTTNQQEFVPEIKDITHLINKKIISSPYGLNLSKVELNIIPLNLSDDYDQSLTLGNLSNTGAITPNEIRTQIGLEEYSNNEEWADKPFPLTIKSTVSGDPQRNQSEELTNPAEKPKNKMPSLHPNPQN